MHNPVTAIVNPTAGGTGPASVRRLRDALSKLGEDDARVLTFDPKDPASQFREAAAAKPRMLVVWGGDGTHRAALDAVGREPSSLLLLPGGTRNLLAKSVHGQPGWSDILASVWRGSREIALPAGELGETRFFCAMLAGAPAYFADAREHLRDGDLGGAAAQLGAAIAAAGALKLAVRFGVAGETDLRTLPATSLVAALVGPLAGRRMEIATLKRPSVFGALDAAWSSFHAGFRDAADVTITPADVLEVSKSGAPFPAMVDGEPLSIADKLRVTFLERGGFCLVAT